MKKVLLSAALFAGVTSLFVSCKKKELVEPLAPGTAIVKGKLTAKLDETSLTPVAVPAGTGVTFIISGEELDNNPQQGYKYDNIVVRGTTDANGNYSVSLPSRKKSINVEVRYDDFEYSATVLATNDQGFQVPTVVRKTFRASSHNIAVIEGVVKVNDKQYQIEGDETAEYAIIKGIVEGVFVDNVGGVKLVDVTEYGSGYTTGKSIPVTGGSGNGMTIDIEQVGSEGALNFYFINNRGQGYKIGDVVTVNAGGKNAKIKITEVFAQEVAVPENVVLTFTTSDNSKYKAKTDSKGQYMIKVPSGNFINVSMNDFEYASTYYSNSTNSYVSGNRIYYLPTSNSFSVSANQILEKNYTVERK